MLGTMHQYHAWPLGHNLDCSWKALGSATHSVAAKALAAAILRRPGDQRARFVSLTRDYDGCADGR